MRNPDEANDQKKAPSAKPTFTPEEQRDIVNFLQDIAAGKIDIGLLRTLGFSENLVMRIKAGLGIAREKASKGQAVSLRSFFLDEFLGEYDRACQAYLKHKVKQKEPARSDAAARIFEQYSEIERQEIIFRHSLKLIGHLLGSRGTIESSTAETLVNGLRKIGEKLPQICQYLRDVPESQTKKWLVALLRNNRLWTDSPAPTEEMEKIRTDQGRSVKSVYLEERPYHEKLQTPRSQEIQKPQVAQSWEKMQRKSEVIVIGDLHGNLQAFTANLLHFGLLAEQGGNYRWIGGNRRVVFTGDILADRYRDGLKILRLIKTCNEQARQNGGGIEIIGGNHDDFMVSFLMGTDSAACSDPFESCRQGDYFGLLELAEFGSAELQKMAVDFDSMQHKEQQVVWQRLKDERETILKNMRARQNGQEALEAISQMKLMTIVDDTLVLHVTPTARIIRTIVQSCRTGQHNSAHALVNYFNNFYARNIKQALLQGTTPEQGFMYLKDLFLDTDSRSYFSDELSGNDADQLIQELRKLGINAIAHGHDDRNQATTELAKGQMQIFSVDMSAFKNAYNQKSRSGARIKTDGTIEKGLENKRIRGK